MLLIIEDRACPNIIELQKPWQTNLNKAAPIPISPRD
jgi:hypothetical protein